MEREDRVSTFSRRELIWLAAGGALGSLMPAAAFPENSEAVIATGSVSGMPAHPLPTVDLEREGAQLVLTGCDHASAAPLSAAASCALVIDGRVLQFGFGRGTMLNLSMAGIDPLNIDELYLMRPGIDFVAEFSQLVTASVMAGRRTELQVYGPPGTRALTEAAARTLFDVAHNRKRYFHDDSFPEQTMGSCKVTELAAGALGSRDGYRVTASRGGSGYGEVGSLVYRVDSKYGSVAFGTGAGVAEAMERVARNVDILVHDITLTNREPSGHGFPGIADGQDCAEHMSASALGRIAERAGVKMLVPYCSRPAGNPGREASAMPSLAQLSDTMASHFSGPVALPGGNAILTLS